MIFQLRTSNDLCGFKGLFFNRAAIKKKISEVVKETEKFRKDLNPEILQLCQWKEIVSMKELENGIAVISIDETVMPDYLTYFGQEIKLNFLHLRDYVNNRIEAVRNQNGKTADG